MKEVNESYDEKVMDDYRENHEDDDYSLVNYSAKKRIKDEDEIKEIEIKDDDISEDENLEEENEEEKERASNTAVAIEKAYNYVKKYEISNQDRLNSYLGDKYDLMDLKGKSQVISLGRTGGHSISFLYLLSQKDKYGASLYSIEDIYNNKKLIKEKQEIFDTVCQKAFAAAKDGRRVDTSDNEASVWLVNTMYEGLMEGVRAIDELAEKVDYSNEQFLYSEEFIKMETLAGIMFDTWQEISQFSNLMVERVRKDHPEFTTYQECKDYLGSTYSLLGEISSTLKSVCGEHKKYIDQKSFDPHGPANYIKSALVNKYSEDIFINWRNSGVSKLSDYCKKNDISFKAAQFQSNSTLSEEMVDFGSAFSDGTLSSKCLDLLDKEISEGRLFQNIKYSGGGRDEKGTPIDFQFTNFPIANGEKQTIVKPGFKQRIKLNKAALQRELDKKAAKMKDLFKANKALADEVGSNLESHKFDYPEVGKAVIANNQENTARLSDALNEQLSTVDLYMMGIFYQTRNIQMEELSKKSSTIEKIPENDRVKDYGDIQKEINNRVIDRIAENGSLDSIRRTYESIALAQVKIYILAGKNYKTIYDALDGQEYQTEKALTLAMLSGGFEMYEAQNFFNMSVLNSAQLKNNFANALHYNRDMTYRDIYKKLGFTEEEMLLVIDKEHLDVKMADNMKGNPTDGDLLLAVKNDIYRDFIFVTQQRAALKIVPTLSVGEQKLYIEGKNAVNAYDRAKNHSFSPEAEEKVNEWQKGEGADIIKNLSAKFRKDQYNALNAVLYGKKTVGLEEKNAMRGAYRELLERKDNYIRSYIVRDPKAEVKADAIINDSKSLGNVSRRYEKLPVSYDSYLKLHTGVKMGKTPEELIENAAKCLAAVYLEQKGESFSVKNIRKTAKYMKEVYSLGAFANYPDKLAEMMASRDKLISDSNALKKSMYCINKDKQNKYFDEMKILASNLTSTYGHGEQYNRLNKYVRMAAELKNMDLKPARFAEEMTKINIEIYTAAVDYLKSKGSSIDVDNNPRAVSALTAIATLTSCSPGLNYRTTEVITDLNRKLARNNNRSARNFENLENFKNRYKASNLEADISKNVNNPAAEKKVVPKK